MQGAGEDGGPDLGEKGMKDADTVFVLSAVEAAVPSHRFTYDKPVTNPDVSNVCV